MCKLIEYSKGRYVADIKYDYIVNIAKQAEDCKNIIKIILFGSAIDERCQNESDIDIAVFGSLSKSKYLKSKEFDRFHRGIVSYGGDFIQDYDILYFKYHDNNYQAIMQDIESGVEIFRRK